MMISFSRMFSASVASAATLAIGATLVAPATAATTRPFSFARPATGTTNAFTVLHAFTGDDGLNPTGDLDLAIHQNSDNSYTRTLWGEALAGGADSSGTVFKIRIGSSQLDTVYTFTGVNDGGLPYRGLAENDSNYFRSGDEQFGVTIGGGASGQGTVFKILSSGGLTTIHTFTGGNDGGAPAGRLTQFTDGNFFGTTTSGGAYGFGTLFKITRNGTFTVLHSFTGNADGASPAGGLSLRVDLNGRANVARTGTMNDAILRVRANNSTYVSPYMYGTTSAGGANNLGTIFRVKPSGTFETLYSFTNTTGGSVQAKLTTDLSGDLFGTTSVAGSAGNGTVFELTEKSDTPVVLHDFGSGSYGATPLGQIALGFDGNLYGTTSADGANGGGSIFKITSKGVFSDIHDFANNDGASPQGGLVDGADGFLYGTTSEGGKLGNGTLFRIAE